MNKTLLAFSLSALTLSALAVQDDLGASSFGQAGANGRLAIGHQPDPRVSQLPVTVGTAPGGGLIGRLVGSDVDFAAGLALFDRNFSASEGLGAPEMNADSCRACHQDPILGGAGGLELNVSRFGDDGGGTLPFMDLPGGQGLSKLHPPSTPGREEYDPLTATVFEQRQTPTLLGAGLIDAIPEVVILANEDPSDSNGDGIFGVARMVQVGGSTEVGRFGWKAQVPRLRDFVNDAMKGELGITTPDDGRGFGLLADGDPAADPELSAQQVTQLFHFLDNLPRPARGGSTDPEVLVGESLFQSVGCATCHIPTLPSHKGPVPLYSDLLLHNVMPSGFRGMAEPGADVGFYRTPPLWGIRDTAPYMHDGRASDLSAAILAHDGEAAGVVQNVFALSPQDRAALLAFLGDL